MSRVFISYGRADRETAERVRVQLEIRGVSSVFMDVGMDAGVEWERELYRNLRSSRAIVALCSQHSLNSKWFFAEITHARAMGKTIFPVVLDASPIHELLRDRQGIFLGSGTDGSAFELLTAGLARAGLLDRKWDSTRPPYPGLLHFEEADAGVFFGREELVSEGLSRLTAMQRKGNPRWLLLLGASGSGKSSLLRAGLLPHLRQDKQRWIVLGPFIRAKSPIESLALAISTAFEEFGQARGVGKIRSVIGSNDPARSLGLAADLRAAARQPGATLVIVADQLEELLDTGAGEASAEWAVLRVLRELSALEDAPFIVLGSFRSDFLGDFHNHPALRDLASDELIVKPLEESKLPLVIEGPAQLAGVELEAGLVDEIVRDTKTEDALPLLAFTLRELYERFGADRLLELREYRRELGGLQQAITSRADEVLRVEHRALSPEAHSDLRNAFLSMVRLGESGQAVRRPLRWTQVPERIKPALQAFVDARLLVSGGEGGNAELTVAHEALFRSWPVLRDWVQDAREFLGWRKRLDPLVDEWRRSGANTETLMRGPALGEGRVWLARARNQFSAEEAAFIEASIRAARHRRTMTRAAASTIGLVIGTLAAVSWSQRERAIEGEARAERAREEAESAGARANEQARRARNGSLMAAAQATPDATVSALLLREAEAPMPYGWEAKAVRVLGQPRSTATSVGRGSRGREAAFSPDGTRVVTASDDGTARVWNADGWGEAVVLGDHGGAVVSATFSPDGTRVVTASDDGTARVWDADGAGEAVLLAGHGGAVVAATFSPDGTRVLTASHDGTARVWSADGSGQAVVLGGHEEAVWWATFSPDGARVVTASLDQTARVWTANGLGEPVVLAGHEGAVWWATFSPDGKRVVTASDDGTARMWNANLPGKAVVLAGHGRAVVSARFSPDGTRVVTASHDATARVWNADGTGESVVLAGHGESVWSATFGPDGTRVVTASDDGTARVWNADGTGDTVVLAGHGEAVVSATFSPDGQRVVTASLDGTTRVWNAESSGGGVVLAGHGKGVVSATYGPDGTHVVTASYDGTARVWNADGTGEAVVLAGHGKGVVSATFSPDGMRVVTASHDRTARVWNVEGTGEAVVLGGHGSAVVSAMFSPDGMRVVTASHDGTARVWNADGRGEAVVLAGHTGDVRWATFSPDGARVVTTSWDRTARVWNADGSGEAVVLAGHGDPVWWAMFSPDGRRVLTASWGRTARLWNADGSGEAVVLAGHGEAVVSATFSPDGTRVVTGSHDGTARVWDVIGSRETIVLAGHGGPVWWATFNADGTRVVTASQDGTARVWSADGTGEPVVLAGHGEAVVLGTFSPDGTQVVTASSDGTARVWSLNPLISLWMHTNHCLPIAQRQSLLGQAPSDADADLQRCRDTLTQCQGAPLACEKAVSSAYGTKPYSSSLLSRVWNLVTNK